jgi:acyl carrier protein
MATGESSKVVIRPELDRTQAQSLVFDALTVVVPGPKAEAVEERQELYADLGIDSLAFAQLLVELEDRLNVHLVDEDLMTIELVTVADLIDLTQKAHSAGLICTAASIAATQRPNAVTVWPSSDIGGEISSTWWK